MQLSGATHLVTMWGLHGARRASRGAVKARVDKMRFIRFRPGARRLRLSVYMHMQIPALIDRRRGDIADLQPTPLPLRLLYHDAVALQITRRSLNNYS
jgi:hypothetical protein